MGIVRANRKAYDHADLVLTLLGNQPVNFTALEYEDSQESQLNYGRGNDPTSYSLGKVSYSGSITLGMDEVAAIERVSPDGDIKKIKPFQIIATFLNEDNGIKTDVITCKFTGRKVTSNSGDMNLQQQLPLLIMHIQYNAGANT